MRSKMNQLMRRGSAISGAKILLFAALALAMLATGCKKATGSPEQQAKKIFETRCSPCHGKTGAGDGAAAASLVPKPRNYHDQAWQKSVSDQQVAKAIVEGGPAIGKSPLMPPNPDLKSSPKVVDALVKIIRGFAASK